MFKVYDYNMCVQKDEDGCGDDGDEDDKGDDGVDDILKLHSLVIPSNIAASLEDLAHDLILDITDVALHILVQKTLLMKISLMPPWACWAFF